MALDWRRLPGVMSAGLFSSISIGLELPRVFRFEKQTFKN
jgi:hypothetical protein